MIPRLSPVDAGKFLAVCDFAEGREPEAPFGFLRGFLVAVANEPSPSRPPLPREDDDDIPSRSRALARVDLVKVPR